MTEEMVGLLIQRLEENNRLLQGQYYQQYITDTGCSKSENKTVVMGAETCINNKAIKT